MKNNFASPSRSDKQGNILSLLQRTNQYWFYLIVVLVVSFILSCSKEDFYPSARETDNPTPRSVTSELDYFARALAKAQSSAAIRGFIKHYASRNAYDDNCAIYALIKDEVVNGNAFHQILYTYRDQTISGYDADFFDEDVLELFPTVSIYIYPGNAEHEVSDWDTTVNTGAFALPDTISSEYDSITVYYPAPTPWGLVTSKIHPYNEPSIPYLCVSENSILRAINLDEETMLNGDSVEHRLGIPPPLTTCEDFWDALHDGVDDGIYITANGVDYLLISEHVLLLIFCTVCDPEWVGCDELGGGGEGDCDRDDREEQETLVKFTFEQQADLRRTCHWTRRWCEFQIDAIFAQDPDVPSIGKITKGKRVKRWYLHGWDNRYAVLDPCEVKFLGWDLNKYADEMIYHWIYKHPRDGEQREIEISSSFEFTPEGGPNSTFSGSVKVYYEKHDIVLQQAAVAYCDPANDEGSEYCTCIVYFNIKECE